MQEFIVIKIKSYNTYFLILYFNQKLFSRMVYFRNLLFFQAECLLQLAPLKEDAAKSSAGEHKHYYDMLHFSPLKVCFSLIFRELIFQ